MTRKTTNILLLISLVFNFAVMIVFISHLVELRNMRIPLPHPPGPRAGLLERHFNDVRPEHRRYMRLKQDFMRTMFEEDFDDQELEKKLDKIIVAQMEMERKLGERLILVRKELSAEEFRRCIRRDRFSPKRDQQNNLRKRMEERK